MPSLTVAANAVTADRIARGDEFRIETMAFWIGMPAWTSVPNW